MRNEAEVTFVGRLVTYVDIADDDPSSAQHVSVALRQDLEFEDGRRVLLLNDRGWSSTATWTERSAEDIQRTSRMVVGPDAPPPGRTEEEMEMVHWTDLQKHANRQGVKVNAETLKGLPHDVVLSQRVLARIGGTEPTNDPKRALKKRRA